MDFMDEISVINCCLAQHRSITPNAEVSLGRRTAGVQKLAILEEEAL